MVIVSAVETRAEPLLARTSGATAAMPGVDGAARLALGSSALVALRAAEGAARIDHFPLGLSREVALEVHRFAPVGPRTRVEVMESDGPRSIAMPDAAYFHGVVAGEPESRVILVADRDTVQGFVASGREIYRFGPDGDGVHRSYAMGDVDPAAYPPPGAFCVNDAHPELALAAPAVAAAPVPAAAATLRTAQMAVETDRELRLKFPSDQAALAYLGGLLAAVSAIYERDLGVRVEISYVRLWGASPSDPWTATDPGAALDEVRAYWLDPKRNMSTIAGPRDLVHFVSGKSVRGGVAYVNVLCSQSHGFGVSQVYGAFDLASPSSVWDVMVLAHEVGHNFGSPHTHCYSPPLDRCYNAEPGCYSGSVVSSRGTIMSYCHLLGGLSSIDLVFGSTVVNRIAPSVQAATCLGQAPATTTSTSSTSTSTSTSTSRPATTSSTTPQASTSSTSTSTSTSSSRSSTSSSSTSSSSTAPPAGDADGDGVLDAADACPATPIGDLVDAAGCSICPCDAMRDGTPWPSRFAYLRCVRGEHRKRVRAGLSTRAATRALTRQLRLSTCGSADLTRCCAYAKAGAVSGDCRVVRSARCAANLQRALSVSDVGPGVCAADACAR